MSARISASRLLRPSPGSEKRTSAWLAFPSSDIHRKRYLYLKWPENTVMNAATLRFREYLINHFNTEYGFTCKL